ncbi:MAG: hypothetical protein ACI90V_003855 [Bacillariaceae sp.]|jgi:hypothetical protein
MILEVVFPRYNTPIVCSSYCVVLVSILDRIYLRLFIYAPLLIASYQQATPSFICSYP